MSSKSIGNTFERKVAKMFTEGIGEGDFIRTPSSGGFVGGKNTLRLATMGQNQARLFQADLIPPDNWTHIFVECKRRKDFKWNQLFSIAGSKDFDSWIQQVYQHAKLDDGYFYFIVFGGSHTPIYISYCIEFSHQWIGSKNHILYSSIIFDKNIHFIIHELTTDWLKQNKELLRKKTDHGTTT